MQIENYQQKKSNEEKLHQPSQQENDARLAGQHDDIRNASKTEILEPFAKAYLGLFLEIDSSFPPQQRVRFIASKQLCSAIMQGLAIAIYNVNNLPSITAIGQAMVVEERIELGYVLLASTALCLRNNVNMEQAFKQIRPDVLSAALCFHFTNSSVFRDKWLSALIKYQPQLVTN